MTLPIITLDLSKSPLVEMSMPDIVGASISGGRSLSGGSNSIDVSGGGYVGIKYAKIELGNATDVNFKYWAGLRAQINGTSRPVIVPFFVDRTNPTTTGSVPLVPFSFSDSTNYSDGTTHTDVLSPPLIIGAVAGNASTMVFKFPVIDGLAPGMWFDQLHATKNYRAYVITDILAASAPDASGNVTYTVAFKPPNREASASGSPLNFIRPRCLMRLKPGTEIPLMVRSFWLATTDIEFIEVGPFP